MRMLRRALWTGASAALGVTLAGVSCGGGSPDMNNPMPGPPPTLTAIMPALGPTSGNTMLTLTGTNFTSCSTVMIGGAMATGVSFGSATQLTATLPAQTAFGKVPVIIARPDGQSVMRGDLFSYYAVSVDFTGSMASGTLNTPAAAAAGDLNGDGKADLVVSNAGSSDLSVFLSTGGMPLKPQTNITIGGAAIVSMAIGDLNNDQKPDLVYVPNAGSAVNVMIGNGSGGFAAPVAYPSGNGAKYLILTDLNADKNLDAVAVTATGVTVLLGSGDGKLGGPTHTVVGTLPNAVAAGDFNGDGKIDLVVSDGNSDNSTFLPGTGGASFGTKATFAVGSTATGVQAGDFDGDGKLDAAFLAANGIVWTQGTGQGTFGAARTVQAGINFYGIAAGDFNGDGTMDLAAIDIAAYMAYVFVGSSSGPGSTKMYATGNSPSALAIGDFDGDQRPDIGVANQASAFVTVLTNASK